MDATPPLVDGDVEHRALDGYQPGVGDWALRLLPPAGYEISS